MDTLCIVIMELDRTSVIGCINTTVERLATNILGVEVPLAFKGTYVFLKILPINCVCFN